MNGRDPGLASAALGLGAGVTVAVAGLLHRTLRPVREIERYVEDIDTAGAGAARNLHVGAELGHLRDLSATLRRGAAGAHGARAPAP